MDVRINEESQVEQVGRNFRLIFPEPLPEGVTSVSTDIAVAARIFRQIEPLVVAYEESQR